MKRSLVWAFLIALLAVDVAMLVERHRTERKYLDLRRRSDAAFFKIKYVTEEESLVNVTGSVPATFPRLRTASSTEDVVEFFLLASVNDCTNSVEDEIVRLNQVFRKPTSRIAGVQGFFVDESQPEKARDFIAHLSPSPSFPMVVKNVLSELPAATTPLVLVVRLRDGKILDAHKPIPLDLKKRDAFYSRWTALLVEP